MSSEAYENYITHAIIKKLPEMDDDLRISIQKLCTYLYKKGLDDGARKQ